MRRRIPMLAAALISVTVVACGGGDDGTGPNNNPPAQQFGSVGGVVRNQASAGVPGATITLTTSGQTSQTQTSGSDGSYVFSSVPVGTWTATLTAPAGFTITGGATKSVTVTANTRATVDAFALTPSTPVTPPNSAAVDMQGSRFVPATVTIVRNGTVTWTNRDGFQHNVTGISGVDSGNFGQGGTRSAVFATAGTFNYSCTLHNGMNGTVIVQ